MVTSFTCVCVCVCVCVFPDTPACSVGIIFVQTFLLQNFAQLDQKFQVYSLLDIHLSFLNAHS